MKLWQLLRFPKGYQQYFRNSVIILLVLLVMGVIFGATMVRYLDYYQQEQLESNLNYFMQISNNGGVSRASIAANSLNTNGIYIVYTTLCGLAVVGLPLVGAMVFFRGMVLGFTVGYLVDQLAWKGMVFCLATLFPFSVVLVPVAVFSGAVAMSFSWLLIIKLFGLGDRSPPPLLGYLLFQLVAFAMVFVLALAEAGAMPWLLSRLLPWVQPS